MASSLVQNGSTVLVTGGAGFIGSNFVLSSILEHGLRVVNLDKLTYAGNPENLAALARDARHVFVHGDIADRALVRRLLDEHRPVALVNFAAESHVDRSIDSPGEFVRTNIVGTYELLEAARAHAVGGERADSFRFVQVSTDEVYGSLGSEGYFTEESRYAPNSPYAASKTSADVLVRSILPHVRPSGHHDELLQQLRAVPVPREAHPRRHPECARGQADPGLR